MSVSGSSFSRRETGWAGEVLNQGHSKILVCLPPWPPRGVGLTMSNLGLVLPQPPRPCMGVGPAAEDPKRPPGDLSTSPMSFFSLLCTRPYSGLRTTFTAVPCLALQYS